MIKFIAAAALGVLLILFLATRISVPLQQPGHRNPPQYSGRSPLNDRLIIKLINSYRINHGFQPLKESDQLKRSSRYKVDEMVRQGYFSHTNPLGDPFVININNAHYRYRKVSEILAKVWKRSENRVLNAWLRSEPHRRAILDPSYEDINCSNRLSPENSYYVACHLGRTSR